MFQHKVSQNYSKKLCFKNTTVEALSLLYIDLFLYILYLGAINNTVVKNIDQITLNHD